jgi:hypothetical protein
MSGLFELALNKIKSTLIVNNEYRMGLRIHEPIKVFYLFANRSLCKSLNAVGRTDTSNPNVISIGNSKHVFALVDP